MTIRILIAEDDPVSAKVLSHMLRSHGEVQITQNGEEAFEAFCQAAEAGNPFDVLFLDIMMPEVDGQEALEAIREYERINGKGPNEGVKVVMVTALTDGANIYQAHRNFCLDYVTKPISKEAVLKAFQRLNLPSENSE